MAGSEHGSRHDAPGSREAAARTILDFLAFSEAIKRELRHSWLSDGRRESVGEHSWQMALMAMLMHPHLDEPVDLLRTLQMVVVHDLVEAEAGDVPAFEAGERRQSKPARERAAMETIRSLLAPAGHTLAEEIDSLWREFEAGQTTESRFARALDHLEVQVQHNLAPFSTWEPVEYELVYTKMDRPCGYDAFLTAFCAAVKQDAEAKMRAHGVDLAALRARLVGPASSADPESER